MQLLPLAGRDARGAGDQHRICPRRARNVSGFHLFARVGGLVRDCAVVEKVAQRADLDGEIDVLGNIAGRLDDSQRIELCTNHADNIAAAVMPKVLRYCRVERIR